MSNDTSTPDAEEPPSWFQRLLQRFQRTAHDPTDLKRILRDARAQRIIDTEVLNILEGALGVSDMQVRAVMVPRSQMVVVRDDESPDQYLPRIIDSGHSRFPVIGESTDDVLGILLAKDLLPRLTRENGEREELLNILRPVTYVPESKRLNVLLREFRENRNHMAIVIDEYGNVSGLVTIEDVLEEIVGDIEDEFDVEEDDSIHPLTADDYMIKALTPIEDFNAHFNSRLPDDDFDTVGGLVMKTFGHLPRRNEETDIGPFHFRVISADKRRIHLLRMTVATPDSE